jgi:hypothetical protein
MAVTRGSSIVPRNGIAENNSDDAQATGNPLDVPVPSLQRVAGTYGTRAGNGASALGGFGTGSTS